MFRGYNHLADTAIALCIAGTNAYLVPESIPSILASYAFNFYFRKLLQELSDKHGVPNEYLRIAENVFNPFFAVTCYYCIPPLIGQFSPTLGNFWGFQAAKIFSLCSAMAHNSLYSTEVAENHGYLEKPEPTSEASATPGFKNTYNIARMFAQQITRSCLYGYGDFISSTVGYGLSFAMDGWRKGYSPNFNETSFKSIQKGSFHAVCRHLFKGLDPNGFAPIIFYGAAKEFGNGFFLECVYPTKGFQQLFGDSAPEIEVKRS